MAYVNLLAKLREIIAVKPLDLDKLSETLRKLRNICATDEKSHKDLGSDIGVLRELCSLIESLQELPQSEDKVACIRLSAQFIGNLAVGNKQNQHNIHTQCFKNVKKLITMGDGKLSLYCFMLLYNVLLGHPEVAYDLLAEPDIVKEILKEDSEFASFIYEELLLKHGEMEKLYHYATNDQRLMLLSTVKENKLRENVPDNCIKYMIDLFKKQSDNILKIVGDYVEKIEPLEICLLLETLASLSGESKYLEILQCDKSLFINCAFLLKSIHDTGKAGDNCFTSIQRITCGFPNKELQNNPAFAFKVDLIRLLSNLCWKNKELQDMELQRYNGESRTQFVISAFVILFEFRNPLFYC
ncbi:ataxin-10 isoform X2 [Lycorma delicatula]|uniref:ataxin-10 isoform X2 n=1 Tax=Lycorma delicatula TaxID=130591 RepID=UPI003F511F07